MEQIDSMIERLDVDSEMKPLKIIGFKATYGLIQTIYTALATIVIAGISKW